MRENGPSFAKGKNSSTRLSLRFGAFRLPPVEDALVIGRRSPVGPNAMHQSLETLSPGKFALIPVEEGGVEALIVRRSNLLKVPQSDLVAAILRQAASIMDESETIHVTLSVEVHITEEFRI